ncbi:MAG: hypothetical protein F4Z31_10385 [Gemmatimonadetes bacterium]|nr:hypothetical protein [Gemmatimonadota bacterium]
MVNQLDELKNEDRSLFPSNFTIRAVRDSRYHNTAYAIAELIDNSIEANAGHIDLLCMEKPQSVGTQTRRRVSGVAILDDGDGMDVRTLFDALKFGGGTRHNSDRGVGKYGMGLPTSSMSQCKRVDVWTWQDGLDSVWHSSIDADDIEQGNHEVPIPDQETPIPEVWREAGRDKIYEHRSGTLVVWTELDKIQWRTGSTILRHTAREVGRIHRHWIDAEMTRIRVGSFLNNRPTEIENEDYIVANDPLYLMNSSSTPEPWNNEPMFREWAKKEYTPIVEGKEVTIEVKYSIVKPEALQTNMVTQNPGAEKHGTHARHNIGVSVIREDREIVLEDAFLREGGSAENPQNRWWGCEVSFRRSCDELFGVDHNKQMAANFTHAAKTLARDDRPNEVILDEMGIDDDIIYTIVGDIRDETRSMMRQINQMYSQRRNSQNGAGKRSPAKKAAKTATEADRDAIAAGKETPTETDRAREQIPPQEREVRLAEQFIASGQAAKDAQQLAKLLVQEDLSYQFNSIQLDGYQIFNVRSNQGVLHINLNTDHPIYDLLKHIEDDLPEDVDENDPAFQASVAIRLLLSSWARMEDQTESREERTRIQDIAMNWGRQVDKAISQLRDRDG